MSDPYTREEMQQRFLAVVKATATYWATVNRHDGPKTVEERIHGAIFSVFALLDGEAAAFPGCEVVPRSVPGDREWYVKRGEKWYQHGVDIAGNLHELWVKVKL